MDQYGSIDRLLEEKDSLPKGMQKKLEQYKEDLMISRKLAAIMTDVPIEFAIETAIWKRDRSTIETYLIEELEFNNPVRWLKKTFHNETLPRKIICLVIVFRLLKSV